MKHFLNHLKKELAKHSFDYLLLITAGIFFLLALNIFKGERFLEFIILLIFVSFYILWGIYHHVIDDSLHLKSVIEYILIGFTIIFLLKMVIVP